MSPGKRFQNWLIFALPAVLMGGSTPSSISLNSSPNASVFGRVVTLSAAVTPAAASGNVTFYDGITVLGTTKLSGGSAALTTILLPSGSRSLKAYYAGDTTFASSTSSTVVQTVNAIPGGRFQAPVHYSAGFLPFSVAIGDFNSDGKVDLAVANFSSNNVSVLLGRGDGTFQTAVNYGAGHGPQSIAVGDFNGDGLADIAVANAAESNVSVLLGNGDGTFRAPVNFGAEGYPVSVAIADFNGDGKADLAIANTNGHNVSVLLGNGDGTFRQTVNYSAGSAPSAIAVADFNGDGRPDLAVTDKMDNNVGVLLGNGDGTFQPSVNYDTGTGAYSVAVGDFNGDGKADLAVEASGHVGVLFGNGNGTFRTGASYGADYAFSLAVGDFNGDGIADLADSNISVLLGLGPAPDLYVTITHSIFTQGQSGAYAITISNIGADPTVGTVLITDSLPPGLTAIDIRGIGWTCDLGALTCTRGDSLAGFASYPVITLTVTVTVGAPGGVTNTVAVSGGGETNLANNTSRDFTTTFTKSQIAQAWSSVQSPIAGGAALLMTDGTVMVQEFCSSRWYRLAPDGFGKYVTGTWSQVASMQPGYAPLYYSSAVLADGRLVVIGGEYNSPCVNPVDTNLGAIYDPKANAWAPLSAPSGWTSIGDAANVVLPDGQFLLAQATGDQIAKLDPVSLTWTNLKSTGKADDYNAEEGWTLLPDGTVLTIDTFDPLLSERYLPSTDTWVSAGSTVAPLVDGHSEIGPQVLRPNGTVFVAGATGHTGVYNVAAGTWAAGPDFPVSGGEQLIESDGPGTLLPSGNVLVQASNSREAFVFEFDGARLNPVPFGGCFYSLLLPTGQVLCPGSPFLIYTPSGSADSAWAPTIATAPNTVKIGLTYTITGTQFNGLSQAVGFGDDFQAATNYPLVRITNTASGHVFYARTHNHSTMGIATGSTVVSTQFDIPLSIEGGPSTLVVVANGIASKPVNLTVALNIVAITTPATQLLGTATVLYSQTLAASGGTPPYTWSLVSGALPAGLSLSSSGVITGTPTGAGTSNFTVKVTDSTSASATQAFTLTVAQSPNFTTALRIAQVADGASWKTLFAITNLDSSPVTYVSRFWDDNGNPLQLPILNGNAGTLSGSLAPGATVFAETPGTSPTLFQGWAEVASSGRIGVLTIFRLSVPGRPDSEGSVTGTLSGNRILLPFDNTQGYVTSVGVANTNPTQGITVSLLFQLEDGTQVPGSLSLPAHTHQAFVLPTMFPALKDARGSIQFSAPSADITVLGLRTNPTNSFTSIGTFQ